MKIRMSIRLAALAAVLMLLSAYGGRASASQMKSAFDVQDWKTMRAIFDRAEATSADLFPKDLPLQDVSIYINGLWRQGKWEEALAMIERVDDRSEKLPSGVAPYMEMLRVLALERTDRKQEAIRAGEPVWETAPAPMKHYLAFALARASRDTGDAAGAMKWFRRMLETASDKRSRLRALDQMSRLQGMTPDEAAQMLIDSPTNTRALALCKALPAGSVARVDYALGYNAYISKQYDTAAAKFKAASDDPKVGEAARYYMAFSLYRQKKYADALKLWSAIALKGVDYPQSSVARIISLGSTSSKSEAISVLKAAAARSELPAVAASALAGIIKIGGDADKKWAKHELDTKYAGTDQAATEAWDEGWSEWKKGRVKAALKIWEGAWSEEIRDRELASRLLYWQARAHAALKEESEADETRRKIVALYPGEYYTFLTDPSGGFTDGEIPASCDKTSELEDWGFYTYARIEAALSAKSSGDPADHFRAVKLAAWDGDWPTSARGFSALARSLPLGESSPIALQKYAFPRAFESEVAAASKRTGLEDAYIWSIMRQESMYEPDATSSAGAFGLMQLMPATARGVEKRMKMPAGSYKTPAHNIMLGANHFVGLMAAYKQSPQLSLAAYNAGGGRVKKWTEGGVKDMDAWVEDIPFNETRGYVKAVIRNLYAYRAIYPKKAR